MRKTLTSRKSDGLLADLRYRRGWKRLTALLSIFVVLGTVSALILPAITLNQPVCDKEEHSHSVDCYIPSTEQQLNCTTKTLNLHSHTGGCRDAEGSLICGKVDYVVHNHDHACYNGSGALVCTLEEIKEHQHSDACYEAAEIVIDAGHTHSDTCFEWVTSETPTCGLEVSSGHQHGDSCYATGSELSCELQESSGHTHDDSCYGEDGSTVCGQEESSGHQHGTDCYVPAGTLICGTEESEGHDHADTCYGLVKGSQVCEEEERDPVTEPGEPVLICGERQVTIHEHHGTCYWDDELTCGKTEVLAHQHSDRCFVPCADVLVCELEEHTHSSECFENPTLTEGEQTQVDAAILAIDALPTLEDVNTQLKAFDDAADEAGREAYTSELTQKVVDAFALYDPLTENQKGAVTNAAQLMALKWLLPEEELPELTEEEKAQVDGLILVLETLPSKDEADAQLAAFDEAGDTESKEAYTAELTQKVVDAFASYNALTEAQKANLTNVDKLTDLQWLLPEEEPTELTEEEQAQLDAFLASLNTLPGIEAVSTELTALAEANDLPGWVTAVQDVTARTQAVRAQYDALPAHIQEDVTALEKLTALETMLAELVPPALTEEQQRQVDDVVLLIEYLPAVEEIEQNFADLEAAGNTDELKAYRAKILTSVQAAFGAYDALPEELRYFVTNAEKLPEYRYLLEDLPMEGADVPVISEVPNISATVTTTAVLPEGTAFRLVPVTGSAEATAQATAFLEGMGSELLEMVLLDMHFVDANGEEYQAEGETEVVLTFEDPILAGDGNVFMLHFTESGAESVAENIQRDENGVSQITMKTDGFSEYGIALASAPTTVTVNRLNYEYWNVSPAISLFYRKAGVKISDIAPASTFAGSYVVVVEPTNGVLTVTKVYTGDGTSKRDVSAKAGGFILISNSGTINASVGDTVTTNSETFWQTETLTSYSASGYGTVTFYSSAEAKEKPTKNNTVGTVASADTSKIININLYDYGTNINDKFFADSNYPGFQYPAGTTSIGTFGEYRMAYGDNIVADVLTNDEVTVTGASGTAVNGTGTNFITGAIGSTLGADGYPVLAYDNSSLSWLFSQNTYATKQNSGNINGLFRYNAQTGAYKFNSRDNHAQYNDSTETFTLYDAWVTSNFIMYPFGNFLPFNNIHTQTTHVPDIDRQWFLDTAAYAQQYYNDGQGERYLTLASVMREFVDLMDERCGTEDWTSKECVKTYFEVAEKLDDAASLPLSILNRLWNIDYDVATDFFFGMDMSMTFLQPKNGITGPNNDQEMVFEFIGDDDVWVFVDGVLFLDLTGIHRHRGGTIDFVNGKVYYYDLDTNTGDISSTPKTIVTFAEILSAAGKDTSVLNEKGTFKDYTTHTFNFYYMERGSGSSVCEMNFNFPLLRQNSITVQKELSVDEQDKLALLGNPDFKFHVLKENCTDLFIGAGVIYDILDANDNVIGTGTTDANGIFTLKAGQRAVFDGINENSGKYFVRELLDPDTFEQYGQITVNGSSETTGTGTDVTIGSDTFKGVNSPVKDVSDGSTVFHFNNQVNFSKLGKLSITKELVTHTQPEDSKTFDFVVKLDGTPLPVGTKYTVGDTEKTVEKEGIITLAPGETAVIADILSGSTFTVQETTESAGDYIVQYRVGDSEFTGAESASGVIKTETTVAVTVKNSERGAQIEIPGTKSLTNPNSLTHTYEFVLEQVTDSTGNVTVEGAEAKKVTVDVADQTAPFKFLLEYADEDVPAISEGATESAQTFYYKLTEAKTDSTEVKFDDSQYIVEVTVTKNADETMTAVITNVCKNGTSINKDLTAAPLSFENTLLSDLTISKTCTGVAPTDVAFRFEVTLTQNSAPVKGTFVTLGSNGAEGEVTFDESGKATVSLKHGESLTIQCLPRGTVWTVTELGTDGYQVSYKVDSAETAVPGAASGGTLSGTLTTVSYTNNANYVLPESGGMGTHLYTIGGAMLMLLAFSLLMYNARPKRRKEVRPPS